MAKLVVLLSGSISSGKTTLAEGLHGNFGVSVLKTKNILRELASKRSQAVESERRAMQLFGEKLDRQTEGAWVRDSLAKFVRQLADDAVVLVDAVRIPEQIAAIRQANFRVMHIHLKAPTRVLAERYKTRGRADFKELQSYSQAEQNKTEKRVARLESIADIVINTELCTERDVLVRAATHLGFYPKDYDRIVDVVVGGAVW